MDRSSTVIWKGPLKEGRGSITTKSRAIHDLPYRYATRFKDEIGTNPEELIASAHAACFTMALSGAIEKEGFLVQNIHTTVTTSLENKDDEWSVTTSHIEVGADVPNLTPEKFKELAKKTSLTCPISRLLKAEITVNARLWNKDTRLTSSRPLPGEL